MKIPNQCYVNEIQLYMEQEKIHTVQSLIKKKKKRQTVISQKKKQMTAGEVDTMERNLETVLTNR